MNNQLSTKQFFERDEVKKKFQELMGKRSTAFMTSVLQIVSQNQLLAQAEPTSIYQAAAVAATLNLPINNNLGYAYIVPYKNQAQFQLGYKGLKQLAQRSGRFKLLNDAVVKEGEIKSLDRLTGTIEFDWIQDDAKRLAAKTVGYVSYFLLDNGFSQTFYMSKDEVEAHARRYSQTYKKGFGIWKDDFDAMALKTVSKLNLSKNAPLSIELETALITDQSVIKDVNTLDVEYIDNTLELPNKEEERLKALIGDCTSIADLEKYRKDVYDSFPVLIDDFETKFSELSEKEA